MVHRTVLELAREDYTRHLTLIEALALAVASGPDERAHCASELATDLRRHAQSEQTAVICPLLVDTYARPLAQRAVAGHIQLSRLASDLVCRVNDVLGLGVTVRAYRAAFVEHVRFGEEELYPVAMLVLGAERCERLADRYEAARDERRYARVS